MYVYVCARKPATQTLMAKIFKFFTAGVKALSTPANEKKKTNNLAVGGSHRGDRGEEGERVTMDLQVLRRSRSRSCSRSLSFISSSKKCAKIRYRSMVAAGGFLARHLTQQR